VCAGGVCLGGGGVTRKLGLGVDVAQLCHRAENAKATSRQLQQRLKHLKVCITLQQGSLGAEGECKVRRDFWEGEDNVHVGWAHLTLGLPGQHSLLVVILLGSAVVHAAPCVCENFFAH
jgi:hypothetical protein